MKRSTYLTSSTFKRFLVLCACLATLASCEKNANLNPEPTTLITDATAFNTKERIANQVNGLYRNLKATSFLGSWYTIIAEARAGEFICTNLNAATGATSYQMLTQTTTNDVVNIWAAGYQAINAANVFIDGMQTLGAPVAGEVLTKNYIAEASLIRAVAYYNLLQLYARPFVDGGGSKPGLPLRLTGNKGPGNYDLKRSTVLETYTQILKDLTYAEQNLPEKYSSDNLNTIRAHKNTAIALKTRVYLSMQDYPNVIVEANKMVSASAPFTSSTGVKHALQADVRQVFLSPYTTTESIFSMPFTNNDAPGSALGRYFMPGTKDGGTSAGNGAGEYSVNPNGIPAHPAWKAGDTRRLFLKVGPTTGKTWLFKFGSASPYLDYAPVIRYAEVLLNLAEALARSTPGTVNSRALDLLNAVHYRSDKSTTYVSGDFANSDALVGAILTERRIEFLGEGIRQNDIMRLNQSFPAKPAHSVAETKPSSPNYIFPISNDELILNKLIDNN